MILNKFKLNDKVAIVTGASAGLGASIAVALAEAGAHVVAHGNYGAGLRLFDRSPDRSFTPLSDQRFLP